MRRSQAWFIVFIAAAALLLPRRLWCQAADVGQAQVSGEEPSADDAVPSVLSVSTGTAEDAEVKPEESAVEESTAAAQDTAVVPEDAGVDVSSAPVQDVTAAPDDTSEVSESTPAVKEDSGSPDAQATAPQGDEDPGPQPSAAQEDTREKAQPWIGVMEEDSNDADDTDEGNVPAAVSGSKQPAAAPTAAPASK